MNKKKKILSVFGSIAITLFSFMGLSNQTFGYTSGLCSPTRTGTCEPDNTSTTYSFGTRFEKIYPYGKFTNSSSWSQLKKLPLRLGESFIWLKEKHPNDYVTNARLVSEMQNSNTREWQFSDTELNFLKNYLANNYKTVTNGKSVSTYDGMYATEGWGLLSNAGSGLTSVFPIESYASAAMSKGFMKGDLSYPIYDVYRYYLKELWDDYYNNGNSKNWFMIKGAMIGYVDGNKYSDDKYIGSSAHVQMSWLIGQTFGVSGDKRDLMRTLTYGAFLKKKELFDNSSTPYYFDSLMNRRFDGNPDGVAYMISNWNLSTNASENGMLSNRYDMPFLLGQELGLVNDLAIANGTVDCQYINKSQNIKIKNSTNCSTSRSASDITYTNNLLPRYNSFTFRNSNNVKTLVKNLWKIRNDATFADTYKYSYLIGNGSGNYFLQRDVVQNGYGLTYYDDSRRADYGTTAYTNVFGTIDYTLLLYKFLTYGLAYTKETPQTDTYYAFLEVQSYNNTQNGQFSRTNPITLSQFNFTEKFKKDKIGSVEYVKLKEKGHSLEEFKDHFTLLTSLSPFQWSNKLAVQLDINFADGTSITRTVPVSQYSFSYKTLSTSVADLYLLDFSPLVNANLILDNSVKDKKHINNIKYTILEDGAVVKSITYEGYSVTQPIITNLPKPDVTVNPTTPDSYTSNTTTISQTFDPYVRFIDNYTQFGYARLSSDYDDDYDTLANYEVSWDKLPINRVGLIISAKIEGDSYTIDKMLNDYRCVEMSGAAYCDVTDLISKGFFRKYYPIKVKSYVCNSDGNCSEKDLGYIDNVLTSTYTNFGYGSIYDKAEAVGYQVYSVQKLFETYNRAVLPAVGYSVKNTIEEQMKELGGNKFKISLKFYNENGAIKMAYDNAFVYTVKVPVRCEISYIGPSQASSETSWSSLGKLVKISNTDVAAITSLSGDIYDDNGSNVGSGYSSSSGTSEMGIDSNSPIVSSSYASYPVKMRLTARFNTDLCSNSGAVIYPNIKICPSKVAINSMYVSKLSNSPTSYKITAYTTYPGSSCGSISNEKLTIKYDGKTEDVTLNNCSINDSGVLTCDFKLTSDLIKYINNKISVDNVKYPLETTLSFSWNSSTGGSGTATKTETIKYQGTCIGSQPYFVVTDINSEGIEGNNGYDPESPDSVTNFINAAKGNDRRLNKKRIKIKYMGCYKPQGLELTLIKGDNTLSTGILPNDKVSQLYVDKDGNAVKISDIFTDADQLNEDRINHPEEKDIILNVGFDHMGIKPEPEDIKGNFTEIQNFINNNATDGNYSRPDIDMNIAVKLYQDLSNKDKAYEVSYPNSIKFFGYCYPYPYLVPFKDKISVTNATTLNFYKDSYITLQYRGCDPLDKIQLKLLGGKLGEQNQSPAIDSDDYKLLGLQQYSFENNDFFDSRMTCNSADTDGDGTACDSDLDMKTVEPYETVTIPFNVIDKLFLTSGKISDILGNKEYDFDDNTSIGFRKDNVLSDYYKTIVNNNFIKGELDTGKAIYYNLYNLIDDAKLRLDISATDNNSDNDVQKGYHDYKGFDTDTEIAKYNRFDLNDFLFSHKPGIIIDSFKVKYLNPDSGNIEDKNNLNYNGVVDIHYKVSDFYPEETNSYDAGEYLGYYAIIQVFDPYNHEIELLRKVVKLDKDKKEVQVPLFFDPSYPDGIYTVKAQIFDKNDNKVYKDQFAAVFIKKSKPQLSVTVKEVDPNMPNRVAIYDTTNNGYIIDGKGLYNNGLLKVRVYLHDNINDYEHAIINNEDSLIFYVNIDKGGNRVVVPKKDIKIDERTGLPYVEFFLTNRGIDNTLYGKALEGINTIAIKDNYGKKNENSVSFNLIYADNNGIPTPYLKEDINENKLKFTNIDLPTKQIKDLKAQENGVNANSLTVYNNNLWLNIGGIIYVKDFTGKTSVKINADGFDKIKIKNGHLIKIKPYVLNIDGRSYSLSGLVVLDYDPENKVGFGLDKNGVLYYIDSSYGLKKLGKIGVQKPQDIVISRIPDGSYELYIVDDGRIKIYNVSNYSSDLFEISKDYGPDSKEFNNTLYTDNIVSIDKHGEFLYYIRRDTDGVAKIGFIPLYQTNLLISINGNDKVIKLGNKTNIDMSLYKELITPIVTLGMVTDSTGKKYFEFIVKMLGKYDINIGGFMSLNGKTSQISGLGTSNIIPYNRVELYKDGNLIYTKELDEKESEGSKDISIKTDYDTNTHMYVIKLIANSGKSTSILIPVLHEVIRIPITGKVVADGTYSGTIKVLDKNKKILLSEPKKFVVYNNTIYTDVALYNSKFDSNNVFNGFNNIEGVQVTFYSNKGLINIYQPLKDTIADYSLYAYGLISNGKKIDVDSFVSPTEIKKLQAYVDSKLDGFVKTNDLVKKDEIQDLSNYNWDNFGGLFICIDKDTADKLKFTIKNKYWAIYNELKKINDNKLEPEKEYLTKEVLDRIRWINETKVQECPKNLGDKFINIKDLLNK